MTDTDQAGTLRKRSRGGGWTAVANHVLVDPALSWKAKGLLAYMLSRPDGWRFASRRIAAAGTDGKAAVQTGLRELRDAGLLRYYRERANDGTVGWVYEVSDEVVPEWVTTARKSGSGTTARFSGPGKSGRSLITDGAIPPSPAADSEPETADGGEGERINQIIAAAIAARLTVPGVFRQGVKGELDNDEVRSRVRRWLVDFPGATDSLYAGCLADGSTAALRGYTRPGIDDELYAAYDEPAESPAPATRPSLRLIPTPEAYQEAPGG